MPAILNEIKDKLINIKKDHDIIEPVILYSIIKPYLAKDTRHEQLALEFLISSLLGEAPWEYSSVSPNEYGSLADEDAFNEMNLLYSLLGINMMDDEFYGYVIPNSNYTIPTMEWFQFLPEDISFNPTIITMISHYVYTAISKNLRQRDKNSWMEEGPALRKILSQDENARIHDIYSLKNILNSKLNECYQVLEQKRESQADTVEDLLGTIDDFEGGYENPTRNLFLYLASSSIKEEMDFILRKTLCLDNISNKYQNLLSSTLSALVNYTPTYENGNSLLSFMHEIYQYGSDQYFKNISDACGLFMTSSTTFRKYERNLSEDENLALDIISAYYRLIIFDTFGIRSYTT